MLVQTVIFLVKTPDSKEKFMKLEGLCLKENNSTESHKLDVL